MPPQFLIGHKMFLSEGSSEPPRVGRDVDRRYLKQVYDIVHGNIMLDPLTLKFINTEQFQRLRDLKQLGLAYMVYPGAVHTRFEHSLGVYWLAGQTVRCLQAYQGSELDIDRFDVHTVELAGLLHDIGYGPFGHMFEHEFLPRVIPGSEWSHEQMSKQLVDYIVDEHHIDIDSDCLKKVKAMIEASSYNPSEKISTHGTMEKHFLYDIVANGRTGIDVDKFDYISRDCLACNAGCNFQFRRLLDSMRVMDDEICYPANEYLTVHKLFATRADLHRTVYTHKKVKAVELMLADALVKANSHLPIVNHISDPAEYWKLDDTVLKTMETVPESRDLVLRIRRRDLYQFCSEYTIPRDKMEYFKSVTAQDIVCSQRSSGVALKEDDVAVSNVKIDLTCGKENPLDRISFFKDNASNIKFPITDERVCHLLPSYYQDRIVRVYAKKPELVNAISDAFENFQVKAYGGPRHETPERKRCRRN